MDSSACRAGLVFHAVDRGNQLKAYTRATVAHIPYHAVLHKPCQGMLLSDANISLLCSEQTNTHCSRPPYVCYVRGFACPLLSQGWLGHRYATTHSLVDGHCLVLQACALLESPGGYYSVNFWVALSGTPTDQGPVAAAVNQGFVHGVLLHVRNRHGNAFRLGSLIYSGPNPYLCHPATAKGASLAARQCAGLDQLLQAKVCNKHTLQLKYL